MVLLQQRPELWTPSRLRRIIRFLRTQTGLVGLFLFDDTSGTARDISGQGNHLTVTGATQGVGGYRKGTAYSFDGTNDRVGLTTIPTVLQPAAITIRGLVSTTLRDATLHSLTICGDDNTSGWFINCAVPDLTFAFVVANAYVVVTMVNFFAVADTLYLLHCTYDGVNMKIYRNGVEVATAAQTGTIDYTSGFTPQLMFGCRVAGAGPTYDRFWPGKQQRWAVYNTGWTASQCAQDARLEGIR